MNYTQFKLSNGDELVAQVVDELEDDEYNIVVKNAMMIVRLESIDEGYRMYSFRPWMAFQQNDSYLQLLNYNHIIGEAKPDKTLLDQYHKSVITENLNEGDSDESDIDTIRKYVNDIPDSSDSSENIIPLFNKNKLH